MTSRVRTLNPILVVGNGSPSAYVALWHCRVASPCTYTGMEFGWRLHRDGAPSRFATNRRVDMVRARVVLQHSIQDTRDPAN